MRPAGFWRRAAAWSLDVVPPGAVALLLCAGSAGTAAGALGSAWATLADALARRMVDALPGLEAGGAGALVALTRTAMQDPALPAAAAAVQSALVALVLPPMAAFVALFLAWCVGFERSAMRATPGKRALGLQVRAADGGSAGTGRVLLRFFAGTLSWASLNLGHLLAALPPAYAALHDRISGTRVLLRADAAEAMPAWARAWLGALTVAGLFANAWAAAALAAAVQAALDRALGG